MLHKIIVSVKKPFLKMLPIPEPKLVEGQGAVSQIAELCLSLGIRHPLVVTDKVLVKLGVVDSIRTPLREAQISFSLFDDVDPDPGFEVVRNGVRQFVENHCDGIVAIGGGSPIDCAKAISACTKTNKDVSKLLGLMRVRRPIYPVIAIPTTSGTGSEGTVAAVISDHQARKKWAITDPFIVPKIALLDPNLLVGLPPQITAETGVDALTHAIESYISGYANNYSKQLSISAIQRIFRYLSVAVKDGNNLNARQEMARASYEAGLAFTRTYIGYVHAVAHQLGAFYHIPHGRANAIVLPSVLRFIATTDPKPVASLARAVGCTMEDSDRENALAFIEKVEGLLTQLGIPDFVAELKIADISQIAKQAIDEAFGNYPVPVEMSEVQCQNMLKGLVKRMDK
ncbi:iron-containing alcohol dehydrogenase [Vibrio superstes]|uniref:Alcohol dehydrogenase n=1 Tax=Vibrio superstes NBRC 103154 TaxID=1219062 RepID=A0A511QPV1_9VIBR|nr:iron-containing alcohol dehydrogenase [Vibrio superstes]GEM78936.1 alcohol dehydrogenase [Vibrio superstes NBRC 103154]